MTIDSVFFTGELPPHMLANPITAMEQLNKWRDENPDVRVISVETAQRIPLENEAGDRFTETVFDGLRVWYET